jgi:predicted outer membrane lipoprotein
MKPIRRKIRSHFGLTAKQVAVRSHRPWYFQWILALLFVVLGFVIAYWTLHDDESDSIRVRLELAEQQNKSLQTELIGAQRELQVELATNSNLSKELAIVQDEILKTKEELVFYKNMLGKVRK